MAMKIAGDTIISTCGKTLDQLNTQVNGKNSTVLNVNLTNVTANTGTSYQIGQAVIPEDGLYLITGIVYPNHYGQSGRELAINVAKNWANFYSYQGVCNTYIWTLCMNILYIKDFKKGDEVEVFITNSDSAKTWSNGGGILQLLKLSN